MQTSNVLKSGQKCKKSLKTVNFLKNDGHFQIPHPQKRLKQFLNICENVVFFYYVGGGKRKMINPNNHDIGEKSLQLLFKTILHHDALS